jgi:RNA polymerase sigma factor (TIGR02999 family)
VADPHSITTLLQRAQSGDEQAWNSAFATIYDELKMTAHRLIAHDAHATLSPTGLVHECYLRLVEMGGAGIQNRAHFHSLAARAMRFVLINRARDRMTQKRGVGQAVASLSETNGLYAQSSPEEREAIELIALGQALDQLEKESPELVRALECRLFAGLSEVESAEALQVPLRTLQRQFAQAKLRATELLAN